jgi:hypothetical protein
MSKSADAFASVFLADAAKVLLLVDDDGVLVPAAYDDDDVPGA